MLVAKTGELSVGPCSQMLKLYITVVFSIIFKYTFFEIVFSDADTDPFKTSNSCSPMFF